MNEQRFWQRTVLVTGAASGIGAATCRRFLAEGASVAALDLPSDSLDELPSTVEDAVGQILTVKCDVSDSGIVDRAVAEAADWRGGLDVVVNNAGVGGVGRAGEVADEDWKKVIDVDLTGMFNIARATLTHLVRSSGVLVNTASISGLFGDQEMVAYDTAKGGVVNFTRATAVDYGPEGVRVNSVCPGPVRTPLLAQALDDDEIRNQYEKRVPLGRVSEPEDIASAIALLSSDDAAMITGVNLPVDGGLTAWTALPNIAYGLTR